MDSRYCKDHNEVKAFVVDIRDATRRGRYVIRRRRECPVCGERWSTIELPMGELAMLEKARDLLP